MEVLQNIALVVLYFVAYSVIGWICETAYCSALAKKFCERGFLTGPYCPIYGFGGIAIQLLLTPYAKNPALLFFMGIVTTSAIEYFTSWAMEKLFHAKWWDYSDHKININGRVCLTNSLLFGVMALFLVYAAEPMLGKAFDILSETGKLITALALILLMAADTVHSTKLTLRMQSVTAQYSQIKARATEAFDQAAFKAGEQLKTRIEYFKEQSQEHTDELSAELRARLEPVIAELEKLENRAASQKNRLLRAFPKLKETFTDLKEMIDRDR